MSAAGASATTFIQANNGSFVSKFGVLFYISRSTTLYVYESCEIRVFNDRLKKEL